MWETQPRITAPASFLLETNAPSWPSPSHTIPSGSLPRSSVSHQLLFSLQRCDRQGHPLPLLLSVTAGSCYSHERLLVVVCRGWEAHWTQHLGSHRMVTKAGVQTAGKKSDNIRGSFIKGYKGLIDGLINMKPSLRHHSYSSWESDTETQEPDVNRKRTKGRSKWDQLLNTASKRGKKSTRQRRKDCKK